MKQTVIRWQIAGFLFTAAAGTFLHFLFDLTGGSRVAALFLAVNESIWEHMKLLFYPMVAVAAVEYGVWGKEIPCFWRVKLKGLLLGLGIIPVIYYTYTGALGVSWDWFNITIFFLAAGAAYRQETRQFLRLAGCRGTVLPVLGILLLAILFTVFTFWPPLMPLFRDPLTGTYGFTGA